MCVFDSNEYIQYTIFNIKNYPKSAAMGFCSKGLENEFETAVVNESSVFEPLEFYCICLASSPACRETKLCEVNQNVMNTPYEGCS